MNQADGFDVHQVSVSYGKRKVIHNLSLPLLRPGTVTALVGPNGAGKSTLLRAMAGLEPCTGQLRLAGADLTRLDLTERGRRVTYMPQTLPPNLALSVLECVIAAVRARETDARTAMREAFDALNKVGIVALADELLNALSGGQRQLVSLAQLLARKPQVMLLDEPTSALDLGYQLKVMECVQTQVRERQAVAVVVLHDLNLAARYADQIVLLRKGEAYGWGPAQEVLTPRALSEVYGVHGRVERCSRGYLQVLVDQQVDRLNRDA